MATSPAVSWTIKGVYDFNVYPSIIGTVFKNVTVLGLLTYELASNYGDLVSWHQQYYPYLPDGTPDDPELFEYLLVRLESGEKTVLATSWIKLNTVTLTNKFSVQVVMENINSSDIIRIRDVLTVNGFHSYTIKNLNTGKVL